MLDRSCIKLLGRYAFDPSGTLWLASSCSEVSFHLSRATYLTFDLIGDGTCHDPHQADIRPRYAVYVNGEKIIDECLNTPAKELAVFEHAKQTSAEIRLVKLSECTQSLLGLAAIHTDGNIRPLSARDLRMEFIGDSITCGYGVEGDLTRPFTTATENAEMAYAYLTAKALGADAMLTAFSGHGLVSGYTEGGINTDALVQPYYEHVGGNAWPLPEGSRLQEIPWDFSAWQPHYIVLNLGTNDSSWCRDIPERQMQYRQKYEEFLATVRKNNPSARILCVLGVMGTGLCASMEQAVSNYLRSTGDTEVRSLSVEEQNQERDGIGSDYHPSPRTQQLLADVVTEALRAWMAE